MTHTVRRAWKQRRRSSIFCARPAPAPNLTRWAWGRSGWLGGPYQHRISAEEECIEGSVASNGGDGWVVVVVTMGEL
jgi:hypothetical protein